MLYVRFSNRPVGVKRFQTTHHCSVDVAHGLVLLFGIGTKALPVWGFEDEVEQSKGRLLQGASEELFRGAFSNSNCWAERQLSCDVQWGCVSL
jgi:hypothetical protein